MNDSLISQKRSHKIFPKFVTSGMDGNQVTMVSEKVGVIRTYVAFICHILSHYRRTFRNLCRKNFSRSFCIYLMFSFGLLLAQFQYCRTTCIDQGVKYFKCKSRICHYFLSVHIHNAQTKGTQHKAMVKLSP